MRRSSLCTLSLIVLVLTGCGMSPSTLPGTGNSAASGSGTTAAARSFTGMVHGGQDPISGATIQLVTFPTDIYPQRFLLTQTVTTSDGSGLPDSNANVGNDENLLPAGYFTISGDYTCPADNPQVFIIALGGNAGFSGNPSNSAIELAAPLGDCNTLLAHAATTTVTINEVTTVGMFYSLASFLEMGGYYSRAPQGFLNAIATFNNIVDIKTGTARATTPNGNGIVPQEEINSLANILASCVNDSAPNYSACAALQSTTQPGVTGSPDIGSALVSITEAPGNISSQPTRVNDIYSLGLGSGAPFQPPLPSAPNDWTMAVSYGTTGGNPTSGALDSLGNFWMTNYNGGGSASSVSMISPIGVPAANSPLQNHPFTDGVIALGIDTSNNVWVASVSNSTVGTIDAVPSGSNYSLNTIYGPINGNALSNPSSVAIDGYNNAWFGNTLTPSLTELASNGNNVSQDGGYTATGLTSPDRMAFDNAGNVWVSDHAGDLLKFTGNGILLATVAASTGGISVPYGLAVDSANDLWVTDAQSGNIAEFNSNGNLLTTTPITGGGLTSSLGIAVDAFGRVWIADRTGNAVSEIDAGSFVTPSTGFQGGNLSSPNSISIDSSGNVWLTNGSPMTVNSQKQTVTEFIGLAFPAIMPLAQAVQNSQVGTLPGEEVPIYPTSVNLPSYTTNKPYSAQLYAGGGNSGTYSWSATGLPNGLTISTSGLISGIPTASGTSTVKTQVCDATYISNCATASFSLSSTDQLAAGGHESALTGSYALRFNGFRNTGGTPAEGQVYGLDALGSLAFDGAGHITGGTLDVVPPDGAPLTLTGVTGAYSIGTDNRGTMVIHRPGDMDIVFTLSLGNFSGATAQTVHFIEFDDTLAATGGAGGQLGAGIAKLQTPAAFAASTLNAAFVFGVAGETPCTDYNGTNLTCTQTISPFGPVSVAGRFVANGSGTITTGEEDAAAVQTAYSAVPLTGSYVNPDATTGRGTLTLTAGAGTFPKPPTSFIYYVVNAGEMFLMSGSSHLSTTLLNGDALAQSGSFSNATLNGNYIAWTDGATGGDGVSSMPDEADAGIFLLAVDSGHANIALSGDEDKAGSLRLNQTIGTAPYTVDSTGRVIPTGANVVFYFANGSQGFGAQQPSSNGDSTGLITLQQQTGSSFSSASINGTYAFGTVPPPVAESTTSGILVANGTNTSSATANASQNTGQLAQGETETFSYVVASNGRTTVMNSGGGTDILYFIDANTAVTFDTSAGDTNPAITYIQK